MDLFQELSTALVLDASIRLRIPFRVAPTTLRSLLNGAKIAGLVLPARHYGSVDVFLEAIARSRKGDILVIDNGGRMDEACIGDLVTLEAQKSGLSGIVVWGCHRDTQELKEIKLPVFSCGSNPSGPLELRKRSSNALKSAKVGTFQVTSNDLVFGDDDGVVFLPREHLKRIIERAREIGSTERRQAVEVRRGRMLREQLRLKEYVSRRGRDSSYTFRKHLRELGGAVEE